MAIYEKYVLPRLIDLVMRGKASSVERARLVPLAHGAVLEIGFGSGLNLPFYGPGVQKLYALDPSAELWTIAQKRLATARFPVEHLPVSAERIPLADATVDTVVTTWTLCSIPDPRKALDEVRRVVKSDGQIIFVEHGWTPDRAVQVWQDRLNPFWRRLAGGCNLNRRIETMLRDARLEPGPIERGYATGLKPFSYLYKGVARPT